jgi:benzoyl-CoA reductase subunit D
MASRLTRLLKAIGAKDCVIMLTGGLALDTGLAAAIAEELAKMKGMEARVTTDPDAAYAGAIGAALWGAFRYDKLADLGQLPKAS